MAEQIAYDEFLCIDQYDISGVSANFGSERTADLKEFVCFPDPTITSASPPYKKRLSGPESAKLSVAGYLDTAVNLAAANAALNASPIITYGIGRALGSQVQLYVAKESGFQHGGQVGEVIPISMEIASDGVIVAGALFEFGAKTATGNGTSRTVTAVTTGKSRYLHVHVISVSGTGTPTLTVIYETSAVGDYTDAVTRHTFTDFTAAGVQRAVKTAAVSDTNGRFRWTISGTNPSFLVRMSEGVR